MAQTKPYMDMTIVILNVFIKMEALESARPTRPLFSLLQLI